MVLARRRFKRGRHNAVILLEMCPPGRHGFRKVNADFPSTDSPLPIGLRMEKTSYSESPFAPDCFLYLCALWRLTSDTIHPHCMASHCRVARPIFPVASNPVLDDALSSLGQAVVFEVLLVRKANSQTMMLALSAAADDNGCYRQTGRQ